MSSMPTLSVDDQPETKRLTAFAADVNQLADQRPDLELRALIDDLHRDLIDLKEER